MPIKSARLLSQSQALLLTFAETTAYTNDAPAKSGVGILTPAKQEGVKALIEGLFLHLSFMAGRLQAPSGGRFALATVVRTCTRSASLFLPERLTSTQARGIHHAY